jgi:hypothetical protein
MTIVSDGIMHIAVTAFRQEPQCTGGCQSCCEGGDRFWYQYLDRALGHTEDPHSVGEIRNEAVDGGAPSHIVAMLDGLLRSLRTCCNDDICWCDTKADSGPWLRNYTQADVEFTNAYLTAMAEQIHADPDYALSFTERPGVGNVCWCGQSVSLADTESLEAHAYCCPER